MDRFSTIELSKLRKARERFATFAHSERRFPTRWLEGHFEFHDEWLVPGDMHELAALLSRPDLLTTWWPQFRDVTVVSHGCPDGRHRTFVSHVKGFLPYHLHLVFRVDAVDYPNHFTIDVAGDCHGRGSARLFQCGRNVKIDYHYSVSAQRSLIRAFALFVRPLVAYQHYWAMRVGCRALIEELGRRKSLCGDLAG